MSLGDPLDFQCSKYDSRNSDINISPFITSQVEQMNFTTVGPWPKFSIIKITEWNEFTTNANANPKLQMTISLLSFIQY